VVPASCERLVILPSDVDLHARPAAQFVRTAMAHAATVVVTAGAREADAKSLLDVLALGAKRGSSLRLRAEGDGADAALDALEACVAGFVEAHA
jgi:phosphotransferase system HPr (HPr) family protein